MNASLHSYIYLYKMLRKWVICLLKDYHITRQVMKVYVSCFAIMVDWLASYTYTHVKL